MVCGLPAMASGAGGDRLQADPALQHEVSFPGQLSEVKNGSLLTGPGVMGKRPLQISDLHLPALHLDYGQDEQSGQLQPAMISLWAPWVY